MNDDVIEPVPVISLNPPSEPSVATHSEAELRQKGRQWGYAIILSHCMEKADGYAKTILSPFHQEANPSFTVFVNGSWVDYKTGDSGDVVDFLARKFKTSPAGALKWLAIDVKNFEQTAVEKVKRQVLRPSFDQICMELAFSVARRSSCARLHVGSIIVSTDYRKVIAWGYNGNAIGLENGCDSTEIGLCGCLHAEENACISCDVPRATPKIVFCTNLPCKLCSKRLINLGGVQEVVWSEDYRIREGLELLSRAGIKHRQYQLETK